MKTASWFTWRGPGRVGISLGTPRGQPGGFRLYRPLNPTREMLQMARPEYERIYFGMLGQLDPVKVRNDLERLAGIGEDGQPNEAVLLCFERPPFTEGNWCHRRMVAAWLEDSLAISVPETGGAFHDIPLTDEGQKALADIVGRS